MLADQTYTERQQASPQPGTCIHCHGSVYVPYKTLGGGDLIKGFELMNQMPFAEARGPQAPAGILRGTVPPVRIDAPQASRTTTRPAPGPR